MRRAIFLLLATLPALSLAAPPASVALRDAQGAPTGTATLTEVDGGVRVTVSVKGVAPGLHGLHLHAVGKCEGPDFKSAGPHFNPGAKEHGLDNPRGSHAGDMPNLNVGPDGSGTGEFVARGATLGSGPGSLFPEGGTALVLHAAPDDLKSDPAGNAGARIACGVVQR
jgi:Cu-Zn family superoxide dismutase